MTGRARLAALATLGAFVGTTACRRADVFAVTAALDAAADTTTHADGGLIAGAIYVAPDGDDKNPGTLSQPLRTIAGARDRLRTKGGATSGDITVYLRGGTYPQTSTLAFGNVDSGYRGFYVKYVAYPGERPVLTGGQPIKGWKLVDPASDVYSAAAGSTPFRQLYVGGLKAIRARSPNLGSDGGANFYRLSGYDTAARNVQAPTAYMSTWNNFTKVEMHLMTAWAENTLRLASYSTSGITASIKFQSPEDTLLFVRPNPKLDQVGSGPARAFYFENALEMLDQAGEWYLDETANLVYYKPRPGEDMATATVVAPMVETILSVKGTSTTEQVSYLWFEGLTFAHSTYLRPSQYGFLDDQAGQYTLTAQSNNNQTVGRPAAGVVVSNANHIRFERNVFAHMAATGLDLVSGTHDDVIIGNVFTQIGGNGISVGKFTADETTEYHIPYNPADLNEICTNDAIKDNYITNVATEFQGACGIACGYPRGIAIEHNEVAWTSFTGISVGFGWTTSVNAMASNRINYNNIHHVASILAGGAAITTLSNQRPASEIQYNYLHDFGTPPWADYSVVGVYLDEGTTGYTVAHNVMINTPGLLISARAGSNTVSDNGALPDDAQTTMATAGIEAAYADIKTLAVPLASF